MKHIAVIGAGSIGRRHIDNLRLLHPKAQLYWLGATGQIPPQNQLAEVVYPTSIDELILLPVDYCVVASPSSAHLAHVQTLLARNIPLLVEKPLAATLSDGLQMQQLCLTAPQVPVAVAYCLRFLPALQLLKSTLDSGRLGKILHIDAHVAQYLPDWRPGKDYRQSVSARAALGGGVMLELSHELDYLYYLFGPLKLHFSLLQQSGLLELDVEDQADLLLSTASGANVSVHMDFLQKTVQRRCFISATEARLEWDLVENSIQLMTTTGRHVLYSEPNYQRNQMYLAMLKQFEQKILRPADPSAPLATVEDALSSLAIIEQARANQRLMSQQQQGN